MTLHNLARRSRSVAGALLAAVSCTTVAAAPATAALAVPTDPNAKGFVGFCDSRNHSVYGGNIHSAPFVWKAIASVPPPKDYLGRGQNAVLNIFQPRPNVQPAEWSGDQLTAATYYTTRSAPSVQATRKDIALSVIVNEFPPMVNGLYQLRMYYGRTNVGVYSATYPATYIRVTGDRWSVVAGGAVNCAASSGQSMEVLTGAVPTRAAYGTATPKPPSGRPSSAPTVPAAAVASGTSPTSPGSLSPVSDTSTQPGVGPGRPNAAPAGHPGGSTSVAPWIVAALAVLVAAISGFAWWRTKRQT